MSQRGYTLVEMLISIGLVALLLLVIIETSLSVAKSHERARDFLEVNSTAIGAFSRFSRDIRRATSVDVVNSTLGASQGKLVLNMKKDDGSNDVTTFYLAEERVKEEYNGTIVGDLTPGAMNVSNLTFRLFTVSSTTAMRIEMTVAPSASSTVPAVNFYSTYVLRGSYTQ
ncbi:MAG: prepilin-type N-terminal cleavage/methylation domain-containing protein [bacterium]|nr:prepilin-type N-terminal cleavage/methylation domain-containing protein [bacterium]